LATKWGGGIKEEWKLFFTSFLIAPPSFDASCVQPKHTQEEVVFSDRVRVRVREKGRERDKYQCCRGKGGAKKEKEGGERERKTEAGAQGIEGQEERRRGGERKREKVQIVKR